MVAVFVSLISQLRFLSLGKTLDNGVLTYVSIFLGVLTGISIRLYQKWRLSRMENIIIEHKNYGHNNYVKSAGLPWLITISVMLYLFFFAITNEKYSSNEIKKIEFTVTCKGQRWIKHGSHNYLCIVNNEVQFKYNLNDKPLSYFSKGDDVVAIVRKGFWGFFVIEKLHNNSVKKTYMSNSVTCAGHEPSTFQASCY
jgi:hypothetical protein